MNEEITKQIIALLTQAQELAASIEIPYLFQPGLAREMIVAYHLGHRLVSSKRDEDACDPGDTAIKYEYLSFIEGGSGQFDRMYKEPGEDRLRSLTRIRRNRKIYFAVFYRKNQIKVKEIYEVDPNDLVKEAERKLDRSKNKISHISFSESWVRENGKLVYEDHQAK